MGERAQPTPAATWLWAVVLLELVSPVPAILTFGALWVLLVRPPWFRKLVADLYGEAGVDSGD